MARLFCNSCSRFFVQLSTYSMSVHAKRGLELWLYHKNRAPIWQGQMVRERLGKNTCRFQGVFLCLVGTLPYKVGNDLSETISKMVIFQPDCMGARGALKFARFSRRATGELPRSDPRCVHPRAFLGAFFVQGI